MTIREFVENLWHNSPNYNDPITEEIAAADLEIFRADGWDLPEGITPENYAETWNTILDESHPDDAYEAIEFARAFGGWCFSDRRETSSTAGDYGPGNPWDAPGMSIHDFI